MYTISPTMVWKLNWAYFFFFFFNDDYKPSFTHMACLTSKSLGLGEQNHHKEKWNVYANIWRRELNSDEIQTNTESLDPRSIQTAGKT